MKTLIISFVLFINCSLAQFCGPSTFVGLLSPSSVEQTTPPTGNGQRPYWRFKATAGCNYTFQTCGLTTTDTELELIFSSPILFNDDYCLLQSSISWECTIDGTYIIFLTRYRSGTCKVLNQDVSIKYKTDCVILPIELASFTVRNENGSNLIKWTTYSEDNSDYFSVERYDGFWESISNIDAAGYSQHTLNYSYLDNTFNNGCVNYYRLRMVDSNGEDKISDIESIDNTEISEHLVKVVNMEGKEVSMHEKGVLILIYSTGTTKIIYNY